MGRCIHKKVFIMILIHLIIFCLFLVPISAAELTIVEENDTSIVYSENWSRQYSYNASGSYYMCSNTKDSTVLLNFYGTGIKWISRTTNSSGIAEISIDGIVETTVDLYSINTVEQQMVFHKAHLDRGNHTIEIKVTGNKSPEAYDAYISVDAFEIIDSDDIIPPSAPNAPNIYDSNAFVELQWQLGDEEDIEGYNVYRSTSPTTDFARINRWLIKGVTTFVDTTPQNGTRYYYHITAVDKCGNESPHSEIVSALLAVYHGYYEERATGLEYTGDWNYWYDPSGGMVSDKVDDTVTVHFYGTGVKWISRTWSYGGIAEVTLDGESEQVDLYNSDTQWQQIVYEKTGLSEGFHTLTIRVTGSKNAESNGTYVYVDAIEVVGTVKSRGQVEEDSVTIDYSGIWDTFKDNNYSGGLMKETDRVGATATYTFYGTGIEWLAKVDGYKSGIAKVSIDDESPALIDLYSPSTAYQQVVYRRYGLEPGKHTIRIETTGTKNTASYYTYINIDAFEVIEPLTTTTPAVPENVSAVPGEGSVALTWDSPGPEVVGYEIHRYRGILEDGVINKGLVREESYTDTGLIPGIEYTYRIAAVETLGSKSDLSSPTTAASGALIHDTTLDGTPGYYEENQNITYIGNWYLRLWSPYMSGYSAWCNEPGSIAKFTFVGTGIKWIGYVNTLGGIAEVWIDGKLVDIVNLKKEKEEYQQVLYQRTHMARGEHTLEIKVMTGEINIDRLYVLDNMEDLTAPEIPQGLTVQKGNTIADISWTAGNEEDIMGYRLYRSTREDGGFVPIGDKMLNILPGTSYKDTGLINGTTYYYTLTAIDESGNESAPSTVVSIIPSAEKGFYEEKSEGIIYSSAWWLVWDGNCSGDYYMISNAVDDTASFVFEGTGIRWIGVPSQYGGKAEVYIDEELAGTVDLYRPETEYGTVVWESTELPFGIHSITIKNISTQNVIIDAFEIVASSDATAPAAPTGLTILREGNENHIQWHWGTEEDLYGYYVYKSETGQPDTFIRINTEAIQYGSTYTEVVDDSPTYYSIKAADKSGNESEYSAIVSDVIAEEGNALLQEDNDAIYFTGVWNRTDNSSASGGYQMISTDERMKVRYTWYGTGIDWIAEKNSSSGVAKVIMDGGQPVLVDLYSESYQPQKAVYRVRDLDLGLHTLEITYYGRNIESTSANISVDAFKIVNADTGTPVPPSNVKANSLVNKVQLTWDELDEEKYPDIIGYNVYYRYGDYEWRKANITGVVQPGFTHTGLNLGTLYYYAISAVDTLGNESILSQEVYAETSEHMIMAVLESKYEVVRGEPFTFTAHNSYTADPPLTYEWDFDGDGNYDDADGVEASYTFDTAGQYIIGLKVKDSENRVSAATAVVDVKVRVTGVYLDKESLTLEVGATEVLTATMIPEDATNNNVTWESNNTSIVTVDQNGQITGISPGTAIITVTTEEGKYMDTCIVTVFNPDIIAPIILGIEPPDESVIGPNAMITVRAEDNIKVKSIALQYSIDGVVWQDIDIVENENVAIFQWNTSPLSGKVWVRAIAADEAGNTSDGTPLRIYEIDNQGPSQITGVIATPRVTSVLLRWDDISDPDFDYFQIEKKDKEGNFQSIGTVSTELGYNVTGLEAEYHIYFPSSSL